MIYSTNFSDSVLDQIINIVLKGNKTPFEIAQTKIILPTRRACRTLTEAFIRRLNGTSILLPQLIPLYDLEDLEQDIPPVIDETEQLLLLTKLCLKKANTDTDKAVKMALSLIEVLDELYQFEIDITRFNELVPDPVFAQHWNETMQFLDIILTAWPIILCERNQIDQADKNIRIINNLTKKWEKNHPSHPIILAGFNGNLPAVRRLIKLLTDLPNATVLCEGIHALSDDTTHSIDENYFLYNFNKLLQELNLSHNEIKSLSNEIPNAERFIFDAFRPAENTNIWRTLSPYPSDTLNHIHYVESETPFDEALTIALIFRKTLETPGKTAALITPDRNLSRRVIIEMERWGITLNDTAGTPLTKTELGSFLFLITDYVQSPDYGHLLALLKNPLCADGRQKGEFNILVKQAEFNCRQKQNAPLEINLHTDLAPLIDLFKNPVRVPFKELLNRHIKIAEMLAATDTQTGAEQLWNKEAGKTAFEFLTHLLTHADILGEIEPASYPTFLHILLSHLTIRPNFGTHPRLSILGPIEGRLYHPDVCILSGLNEGIWPTMPETGPWINRLMREKLGLPALEEKIAESAFDFAHHFCSKEVYLTRSLKQDGNPTIPSRFLARIEAVAAATGVSFEKKSTDWAIALNTPDTFERAERPSPTPPVALRPKKLSVTEIEKWMRDPYYIYAKHILKLVKLNPLDEPKKNALLGQAIHQALSQFICNEPKTICPEQLELELINTLKTFQFSESELLFYRPNIKRMATWIANEQNNHISQTRQIITEIKGKTQIDDFTLTGVADRIDLLKNGNIEIIDYKTGSVPKPTDVKKGYNPQLPLEAFMAKNGAFAGVPSSADIQDLAYWKISGKVGKSTVSGVLGKREKELTLSDLIKNTVQNLRNLIELFNRESTPYEPTPVPSQALKYNDYEHLSRKKEWMHETDGEGEDE